MSKIFTIGLLARLLSLVVAALKGALDLGSKIADLVDDGSVNGSFERPTWMMNVESGLEYAQRALTCLELASGFAAKDASRIPDDDPNDSA